MIVFCVCVNAWKQVDEQYFWSHLGQRNVGLADWQTMQDILHKEKEKEKEKKRSFLKKNI